MRRAASKKSKEVVSTLHKGATRKGIPTSELESFVSDDKKKPVTLRWPRNPDLDPQLVWRGKDAQDGAPLEVDAYPIYIQEKIHPKTIIADLKTETAARKRETSAQLDLFADFNGVPKDANKMDFYSYDQNWTNRMILGDSLQVMASLAEKEDLRGKVQCIYFDPPYGIKFNSNFQWSTTTTNVKDGVDTTQEPEMVKAFRDTWRDGIHSYLSYLRDRLTVARDLLADGGSIFVQIGDENVHRVRALLDEVFGEDNFVSMIVLKKSGTATSSTIACVADLILFFAKDKTKLKYRDLFFEKKAGEGESTGERYDQVEIDGVRRALTAEEKENIGGLPQNWKVFKQSNPCSQHDNPKHREKPLVLEGNEYYPPNDRQWSSSISNMERVVKANRLMSTGRNLAYIMYVDDYPVVPMNNIWTGVLNRKARNYIVETAPSAIQRCILMTTDPGDLVLDPTCGSGTTAYVAEQWGRRWITIDTSRVALALARARLMGARYPYYILADTQEGQRKEAEASGKAPSTAETFGRIRQGFVYERVPHITLKSIANNTHIDDIWEEFKPEMDGLREKLGGLEEWELPRLESEAAKKLDKALLEKWWELRKARQKRIDDSIQKNAEYELLYDKPYTDNSKVRVSGPFTIESLSPYRSMIVGADEELIDPLEVASEAEDNKPVQDFAEMIIDELRRAGVQQSDRQHRISFTSMESVPGNYICACGTYERDGKVVHAGIIVGPEFGTVTGADLTQACREAKMLGYDEIICCAFSYEANIGALEFPGMPIIKARMNAELHMAGELKSTGTGNLFVVFGEPTIKIKEEPDGKYRVKIEGVDIFDPKKGEVRSSDTKDIACWFVDTNYNAQSFFVRQAYFLGQKDPYEQLKKTLNTEIDREAWASLNSDVSRPFEKPETHHIAVKIINHLGDEVMKVYRIPEDKSKC